MAEARGSLKTLLGRRPGVRARRFARRRLGRRLWCGSGGRRRAGRWL